MDKASTKLAQDLSEEILNVSLTKPLIINRILEKRAFIIGDLADGLMGNPPNPVYPNSREVDRSYVAKLLTSDDPEPPSSGVKDPTILFASLGALYAGYATLFGRTANPSSMTAFIAKHPWLAPLAGIGLAYGVTKLQDGIMEPVNESFFNKTAAAPTAGMADLEK